jgi:hypothetical protein
MREKSRIVGATSGALGLGAFAAAVGACCALPWAVALLGVTGAVALARLSFLLPYALIGAAILLTAAFWWAYRPQTACATEACKQPYRGPLRWLVWGAAALVVFLAAVGLTSW